MCSYGTFLNMPMLINAPAPPCIEYVLAGTLHIRAVPAYISKAQNHKAYMFIHCRTKGTWCMACCMTMKHLNALLTSRLLQQIATDCIAHGHHAMCGMQSRFKQTLCGNVQLGSCFTEMMLALMTDPRMPQGLPGLLSKLVPASMHTISGLHGQPLAMIHHSMQCDYNQPKL